MATRLVSLVLLFAGVSTLTLAAERIGKVAAKPGSRIEREGHQIFLKTDADNNGQLCQDEFQKSEKLVVLRLDKLVAENAIGGAKVLLVRQLPDLSQRVEIGEEDFIDYFQIRAAENDDAVRQQRMARVDARRRPRPEVVAVVSHDAGTDLDCDWRERANWERRRDRCYRGPMVTVTQSVERRHTNVPLGNNPFPMDRPMGATLPRSPGHGSRSTSGGAGPPNNTGGGRSEGGPVEKPSRIADRSSKSSPSDKRK